jgi:hypothetical protein
MATPGTPFKPLGVTCSTVERRAEVAELEDALDSKSSGASPRAGSIPAFGTPLVTPRSTTVMKETSGRRRS